LIKVEKLVKYYGNHRAVDNVSFELQDGKIYGLLGPNGAGKSTIMNVMTGYIGATSGTVEINGHEILEEPEEAKKNLGYLPEIPPLYQDMTPHEYLMFIAELKKVSKKVRLAHVREIEERTKIDHMADRLIKHLSKGYKQRVGLAGALVSYPDVIILDEPTVGLDPKQINEMRELISSLREKHTVILSSHILQEVSAICDEILIISNGHLVANGTPEEIAAKRSDDTEILYKFETNPETVKSILSEIEGINKLACKADSNSDNVTLCKIATSLDAEALQKKIFFAFAKQEIAILESNVKKKSLEDLFLEITSQTENEKPSKRRRRKHDALAAENDADEISDNLDSVNENAQDDHSTDSNSDYSGEDITESNLDAGNSVSDESSDNDNKNAVEDEA
jgi:ABC-2 type transport system ATP-binding protein